MGTAVMPNFALPRQATAPIKAASPPTDVNQAIVIKRPSGPDRLIIEETPRRRV
jgi:hypothetical protein